MAISRHSQIFQAKDYVKPFDLSVYSSLINQRQNVFDTNLKALSGSLAKYTSLPIYRPGDKEYVANKVSSLSNDINNLNATDYSDPAVFSQINTMISSIGNDQRIKNALLSSAAIDKDGKDFEQAKKDKSFALSNAYEVEAAQSRYLNSTDENAVYQSPGYKAYKQDGFKNVIEFMSKAKKDGSATVETIDVNGNRVPATYTWEGLKPEDVRRIAASLTSADDYDQLYRDGQYVYRGVTDKPEDAYSRRWIVENNKQVVSNKISASQGVLNQLVLERENIMASNDPNKTQQLAMVEAGIKAQQDNVKTIQGQLADEDYLYKTGVKDLYNLKNQVYLEDRFSSLGELLGYNITNVKLGNTGKTGTKHGAETFVNENGELETPYYREPVTSDNSQMGHTKNYILGQMQQIQSKLGTNGQLGSLASNEINKMIAADPAKANLGKDVLMTVYKQKEQEFNEGKLSRPEDEDLRKHFVEMSDLRSQQYVLGQLQLKAQTELQRNPEYVRGKAGLEASIKNDLKDFYDIPIQTDYGKTETKRYSKEAILNFIKAKEQKGLKAGKPNKEDYGALGAAYQTLDPTEMFTQIPALSTKSAIIKSYKEGFMNFPSMDVDMKLDPQEGDNSLINDVNEGMANYKMTDEMQGSFSRSVPNAIGHRLTKYLDLATRPIRSNFPTVTGSSTAYMDPLAHLEERDPLMRNHLRLRDEYAALVKDSEDRAYEKLGYTSMVPTFTPSQDPKVQNELLGTAQGIVTSYEVDKSAKARSVESVAGLRLYPDGQIGVTYSYKEGDKKGSAVVKVPRNQAGTFAQYMPEDEYIVYQNSINRLNGTSSDIQYAPKVAYGSTVMAYRIWPTGDGQYQMQIFENGKLNTSNRPELRYSSVKSLVKNAQLMVQEIENKRRSTGTR